MKALIRQYPINCDKQSKEEVLIESDYPDWVNRVTGQPLVEEPYYYAMCNNLPAVIPDSISASDFRVEKHTKEVTDEYGEIKTVTYYLAYYEAN